MSEAMPDKRLSDIGKALTVTDAPTIAHELYDEVVRLRAQMLPELWLFPEQLTDDEADELMGLFEQAQLEDLPVLMKAQVPTAIESNMVSRVRARVADELLTAKSWHPDNAAWCQDLDQASYIARDGLWAYADDNKLPHLTVVSTTEENHG